ncbi:MAG: glycerophosphodiester phosphodiesterase [Cyanobacteria bacterium NC_groundwater_1444_Ag_S-0.65um_54_12]|nr:glycerophosphodiester phosphodiesterase [Cyanobacteria bacterium NC_groundwater_1444_Ag_S-0.65um_54_12]
MFSLLLIGEKPYVIGHRGARGHAPENTLAAFRQGVLLGADLLECDVRFSHDWQLVVIHDETVDRTTDGSGKVSDMTLAELQALDAGMGEHVPALAELLDWINWQKTPGIVIEIKNESHVRHGIGMAVARAVQAHELIERAIVISFDQQVLVEAKKYCQQIATGVLYDSELADPVATAQMVQANSLWPAKEILTAEVVIAAHAAHLGVFTWTVNSPDELQRAIVTGVDGIGTDFPEVLRRLLSASPE